MHQNIAVILRQFTYGKNSFIVFVPYLTELYILLQVCGTLNCCYTPWQTGNFDEGQLDIFSGPSSLGECSEFTIREAGQDFSMG